MPCCCAGCTRTSDLSFPSLTVNRLKYTHHELPLPFPSAVLLDGKTPQRIFLFPIHPFPFPDLHGTHEVKCHEHEVLKTSAESAPSLKQTTTPGHPPGLQRRNEPATEQSPPWGTSATHEKFQSRTAASLNSGAYGGSSAMKWHRSGQ